MKETDIGLFGWAIYWLLGALPGWLTFGMLLIPGLPETLENSVVMPAVYAIFGIVTGFANVTIMALLNSKISELSMIGHVIGAFFVVGLLLTGWFDASQKFLLVIVFIPTIRFAWWLIKTIKTLFKSVLGR